MSSQPGRLAGTDGKMRGMLPASLRAGTITLTVGGVPDCLEGSGRAIVKLVSARWWNGQNRTKTRLAKAPSHGILSGSKTSGQLQKTGQVVRGEPVLLQAGLGQPQPLGQGQGEFPQSAVAVEDDPRSGVEHG